MNKLIDKYKFCPLCGGKFSQKNEDLLVCSNCSYQFYINPKLTNAGILENEKGEILLVKRKWPPSKGKWDLPGGFLNPGEDMEESLKREIKEELGVDIEEVKYFKSYADLYEYQEVLFPTLGITLTANIKGKHPLRALDDVGDLKYFPKDKIPFDKLAFKGIKQALEDYIKSS